MPDFHGERRFNFPKIGQPGDIYFDTDRGDLYVVAAPPDALYPGLTDYQNVTHIFSGNLTVKQGLRINVPTTAAAGTIFLTTDTFEAFAGTGTGIVKFHLDVRRALRGADPGMTF